MPKDRERFVPTPMDWFGSKTARRLLRRGKGHQEKFLYIVHVACAVDDKGKVTDSTRETLDFEDLADRHDRDEDGWEKFIEDCHDLDLVETDSDGFIVITDYRYWVRRPSDMPEATRERKKKSRSSSKSSSKSDENVTNVTTGHECHDGHECHECHEKEENREEQNRKEQKREHENRKEQTDENREESEKREESGKDCLSVSFSEFDFENATRKLYSILLKSEMPSADMRALKSHVNSSDWQGYEEWQDRAGGIQVAVQMVMHKQKQGEEIRNPWKYAVNSAHSFLEQAKEIRRANQRFKDIGKDPIALKYNPPKKSEGK